MQFVCKYSVIKSLIFKVHKTTAHRCMDTRAYVIDSSDLLQLH